MGPTLLGRILDLNDTQTGVLEIAFKLADDRGLLLLDLDDLRALLGFVADNRKEISTKYGLVSGGQWGDLLWVPSAVRDWWKPWPNRLRAPLAARSDVRFFAVFWAPSRAARAANDFESSA